MLVNNILKINNTNNLGALIKPKKVESIENRVYTVPIKSQYNVSFSGKELSIDELYDDFMSKFKQIYDKPLKDLVSDITCDDNNIIGEGTQKVVYKIPGIDDYLMTVNKFVSREEADFKKNSNFI